MKLFLSAIIFLSFIYTPGLAAVCDGFVSWVAPAKDAYFKEHRTTIVLDEFINNEKVYTGIHSIVSFLEEINKDATS